MSQAAIALVALAMMFYPHSAAFQVQLEIRNLNFEMTDDAVIVTWRTTLPADSRVDFGLDDSYGTFFQSSGPLTFDHRMVVNGLLSETIYHFKVTSQTNGQVVSSFDQLFETKKFVDRSLPLISNVNLVYVTGSSATFQWETDEDATSIVRIGKTTNYTGGASDGNRKKIHDITVGGLAIGTGYHAQVASTDKDGNTSDSTDIAFRTLLNLEPDRAPLTISDVRPLAPNDPFLSPTSATISWQTNKLATARVEYGDHQGLGAGKEWKGVRRFFHAIPLENLKPGTRYYYRAVSQDVFGAERKSEIHSFATLRLPKPPVVQERRPVVLGFTTVAYTQPTALYKAKGPEVYAIVKNQKHLIMDAADLKREPYAGISINEVSAETLEAIPDARLVKAVDGTTVYYLYKRQNRFLKLAIPSPEVFVSYPRNKWDRIISIDVRELARYPDAVFIKTRDRKAVYLLERGMKRPFLNARAFESRGYRYEDIVEVGVEHLAAYTQGPYIE